MTTPYELGKRWEMELWEPPAVCELTDIRLMVRSQNESYFLVEFTFPEGETITMSAEGLLTMVAKGLARQLP